MCMRSRAASRLHQIGGDHGDADHGEAQDKLGHPRAREGPAVMPRVREALPATRDRVLHLQTRHADGARATQRPRVPLSAASVNGKELSSAIMFCVASLKSPGDRPMELEPADWTTRSSRRLARAAKYEHS
eukprot:6195753-Pleurochrysis_carterae.AAC.2